VPRTRSVVACWLAAACLTICAAVVALPASSAPARRADTGSNYKPLPAKVVRELTSVSPATLAAVGSGSHRHAKNTPPKLAHLTKLTKNGKPELVFLIGEFCPFCASESWSAAVALSRFGTFHGLTTLASSAEDSPPSIKTMSFRYSRFHSRYLDFNPVVVDDTHRKRVDPVPRKVRAAWKRKSDSGFPFLDFAGKAWVGSSYDPSRLANLSRPQIASDLSHPKRPVAQAIDGSANQITAAICLMTGNQPAKICRSKSISKIRRSLRRH
jgi:hypothetical protein